ncbi:hypothetical protein ABZ816_27890 [Actinosynnema sp. NPDC047251]|uniref:Uncharacterized protein n=1 Tax=Saccharothrix espanaensis (strain ATCC 51144 / DSM 44229 / JCM 9112 / NBRC 15066 / NRRL 15764) TaxID=1179773 RepID=K0JSG9_SACES|nr:hypothetical protein [Saccharothrix espanaensis]CCH28826.1 hypothetical protein BN6_15020 [Saccharothrix espanaensis DSM 44229]
MAGVIVYEPDDDAEVEGLPWAITFEASAGEDWDSFVCGPYERDEAVALAESVIVEGRGVTAVVEPLLPVRSAMDVLSTIDELREEVEDPT